MCSVRRDNQDEHFSLLQAEDAGTWQADQGLALNCARHVRLFFNSADLNLAHSIPGMLTLTPAPRLAGLSRQVANKALASIEAAGLVKTSHDKIVVPSPEKLGRYGFRDEPIIPAAETFATRQCSHGPRKAPGA